MRSLTISVYSNMPVISTQPSHPPLPQPSPPPPHTETTSAAGLIAQELVTGAPVFAL